MRRCLKKFFLIRVLFFSKQLPSSLAKMALLWLGVSLYFIVQAPEDYQQKIAVKMLYVHVPFAWLGLLFYLFLCLASVALLWKRACLFLFIFKASAVVGGFFTFLTLATGAAWGRISWGVWWVWDARLTSMLLLFVIYCGILSLSAAFEEPKKGAYAAAILSLFGFIDLPIIKYSVQWWHTLHQPASLFRMQGSAIDAALLKPLFFVAIGFLSLASYFFIIWTRIFYLQHKQRRAERNFARTAYVKNFTGEKL